MNPFVSLILLAIACCLAIFAGPYLFQTEGYVLLGYGRYYVESTLLGFLLAVLLAWLAIRVVIYLVRRIFHLKGATASFFSGRGTQKANMAFQQGLTAFLLQDWPRAEKLLTEAGNKGDLVASRQLYAAVAADAMGEEDKAFEHLATLPDTDNDAALIKAGLLIKQQELEEAALIIQPLYKNSPKNDSIFSAYIKLLQVQKDWVELLALLPKVEKQGLFGEQQLDQFSLMVLKNALMASVKADTAQAAEKLWKSVPGKMKKRHDALAVYIEVLANNGEVAQAETLLLKALKALKKAPLTPFVPLFSQQGFAHSVNLNSYLQTQLKADEDNPDLLCALGYLAVSSEDYSLATKALSKVAKTHPQQVDLWLLADAYTHLGDNTSAVAIYRQLRK